jgi:hypothetical protein
LRFPRSFVASTMPKIRRQLAKILFVCPSFQYDAMRMMYQRIRESTVCRFLKRRFYEMKMIVIGMLSNAQDLFAERQNAGVKKASYQKRSRQIHQSHYYSDR